MRPNDTLCKILSEHQCRVAYKDYKGSHMDLWISYDKLTKQKLNTDLNVWGDAQKVFENVSATVRRFYPDAELSSQTPNRSVVYRINYGSKVR